MTATETNVVPQIPSGETLIQRAQEMVPRLAERRNTCRANRQVPQETLDEMRDAGLLRITTPSCYGGYGLGVDLALRVVKELGRGCPSTAWVHVQYVVHTFMACCLEDEPREKFFSTGPDSSCATIIAMSSGEVKELDDGIRLTGTWQYASGVDGADWVWVMTIPGHPGLGALVPRGDYTIVDDWEVVGLEGTGSKQVVMKDVHIPSSSLINAGWQKVAPHTREDPTLNVPVNIWGYLGSASIIGNGLALVDEFKKLAKTRTNSMTGEPILEDKLVHVTLAEAMAEISCAELLLDRDLVRLRQIGESNSDVDTEVATEIARNTAYGCRLLMSAGQRLLDLSGSSVIYDSNELGLLYRDILAGTRHAVYGWDFSAEQFGRAQMGLELLKPFRGPGR